MAAASTRGSGAARVVVCRRLKRKKKCRGSGRIDGSCGRKIDCSYLCIIACRKRSAAGEECCGLIEEEGEVIVDDLVDQLSAGAGSTNTVGMRLADFEDRGGGRGLRCLLKEGECRRFLSD